MPPKTAGGSTTSPGTTSSTISATLFRKTKLNLRYHEGLSQEIAQNQFNENDKDRHQSDFSARMERTWASKFRTTMVFAYQQIQDFNIRESRSSNNNVKELLRAFAGICLDHLAMAEPGPELPGLHPVHRLFLFRVRSGQPGRTTTTSGATWPPRWLSIRPAGWTSPCGTTTTSVSGHQVRHRRRPATCTTAGISTRRSARSKCPCHFPGRPGSHARGVHLPDQGRPGNLRHRPPPRPEPVRGRCGPASRCASRWFQKNPLELSAMVRKYNAFGPSVTETSSDYWEADIWLKWEF